MPTRDEWAVIGLILGAVAVVGVAVWVLSRKKASPRRLGLKKISGKTTYSNIEEYEIFEDRPGVIKVRIHRKAQRG